MKWFGFTRTVMMRDNLRFENQVHPILDPDAKDALGTLFLDWRTALFPIAPEDTADDPEELYVRVLEVLEKSIGRLQGR